MSSEDDLADAEGAVEDIEKQVGVLKDSLQELALLLPNEEWDAIVAREAAEDERARLVRDLRSKLRDIKWNPYAPPATPLHRVIEEWLTDHG